MCVYVRARKVSVCVCVCKESECVLITGLLSSITSKALEVKLYLPVCLAGESGPRGGELTPGRDCDTGIRLITSEA